MHTYLAAPLLIYQKLVTLGRNIFLFLIERYIPNVWIVREPANQEAAMNALDPYQFSVILDSHPRFCRYGYLMYFDIWKYFHLAGGASLTLICSISYCYMQGGQWKYCCTADIGKICFWMQETYLLWVIHFAKCI